MARGLISLQGEQKQTVAEDRMLEALLAECRALEARVNRGEARLTNAMVEVKPPEPLPRNGGGLPLAGAAKQ